LTHGTDLSDYWADTKHAANHKGSITLQTALYTCP